MALDNDINGQYDLASMDKFVFKPPLREGIVRSRPNRFIMNVDVDGVDYRCHCPSTGRIGAFRFKDVPCLVSESMSPGRKTPFTVEAISPDTPGSREKRWIGINQTKANDYVAFFLKGGLLPDIFDVHSIAREVPLGHSRIDFLINDRDYLEVKMPLNEIIFNGEPRPAPGKDYKPVHFERIVKHFSDVADSLRGGSRAVFLLCYMYDAAPFEVPPAEVQEAKIVNAARHAEEKGVEYWQANFALTFEGVSLIRYFPLRMFPG